MKNKYLMILILLTILISTTAVSADQIELQNGEVLRGEITNSSIKIRSSYAEINIQNQFFKKIERGDENFIFHLSENNRFSGVILEQINLTANSGERTIAPEEIKVVEFSDYSKFNNNRRVSVTTTAGDFFFANTVEDSISIKTSLGSPLNIKYSNIVNIEYLKDEEIYLIRRSDSSEIKAEFAQQKIIIWPAAGEIFEFDLNYLQKLLVN